MTAQPSLLRSSGCARGLCEEFACAGYETRARMRAAPPSIGACHFGAQITKRFEKYRDTYLGLNADADAMFTKICHALSRWLACSLRVVQGPPLHSPQLHCYRLEDSGSSSLRCRHERGFGVGRIRQLGHVSPGRGGKCWWRRVHMVARSGPLISPVKSCCFEAAIKVACLLFSIVCSPLIFKPHPRPNLILALAHNCVDHTAR